MDMSGMAKPETPTPPGASATVSQAVAAFCAGLTSSRLPPEVLEKARVCLMYGLGIGLSCLDEPTAAVAAKAAAALDGPGSSGPSTAWVDGRRLSVGSAAFANAVLLHARCQEDTSGTAHLGVSVIAALCSLAQSQEVSGEDFLCGLVAGYEIGGALERCLGKTTLGRGLRASPLYGTVAVAAAAARALALDAHGIGAAIANAASFTGGTLQSIAEGTDEWRYQVGMAALGGLQSAFLAAAGSVSCQRGLDGDRGFAPVFAGRQIQVEDLALGQRWNLPAVTFKPYPVCAHNQTVAAVAAMVHRRVRSEDIISLRIRIDPYVVPGMLERGPFTRVSQTLLSTYFCGATAAVHGTVSSRSLACFDDPRVAALLAHMEVVLDPGVTFPGAAADVQTRHGDRFTLEEARRFEYYSLPRPEVRDQLHRLCEESGIPRGAADALERMADGLPGPLDLPGLLDSFAAARSARGHSPKRIA